MNMIKKVTILTLFFIIGLSTIFAVNVTFYGPKQYTRNKGKPVTETDTFTCPVPYAGPGFTLRVLNGDAQGNHRVSSGTIEINGGQIIGPSDFNQDVGLMEQTITLNDTNEIKVKLSSSPGSYITLDIYKFIPVPDITFSASPETIPYQSSSTLTWTTVKADSVGIDNGLGNVPLSGSASVSPGVPTTTYTLTATNLGGSSFASVTVTVLFPQPTVTFTASPLIIKPGAAAALTWTTLVAHTVTIDQGIGQVDLNGSLAVTPPQSLTYTITAAGYGGTKTAAATVTLDGSPPEIVVSEPAPGSFLKQNNVRVKGQVQDSSPVTLKVNGMDVALQGPNFDTQLNLPGGENTVTLVATDSAGNETTEFLNFTIDITPPDIQIQSPENNAIIKELPIAVTGVITEINPLKIILNGTLQGVIDGNSFTFNNVNLNEGENQLSVTAEDKSGNTTTQSINVSYIPDSEPPVITITSPRAGAFLKTPQVKVIGTAVDEHTVIYVRVNGVEADLNEENFTCTLTLTEGENGLTVESEDNYGNQGSVNLNVTLDSILPEITVTEPDAGAYLTALSVWVRGEVNDATPVTLTVNGTNVPLTDASFENQVQLTEGLNNILINASDSAGNRVTKQVELVVDATAPQIKVDSPIKGSLVGTEKAAINGSITETYPSVITLTAPGGNPLNGEIIGNNFYFKEVLLNEGVNTFIIDAQDKAGNVSTLDYSIIRDTTAPVINIMAPAVDTLTRDSSILVTGTVTDALDNTNIKFFINGIQYPLTNNQFQISHNLIEGINNIRATARDSAGNRSQAATVVKRDTIAPLLNIFSPAEGSVYRIPQVTLSGRVDDASLDGTTLRAMVNGNEIIMDCTSGNFSQPDVVLQQGENVIEFILTDPIGNTTTRTIRVHLDTVIPSILSVLPSHNMKDIPLAIKPSVEFSENIDPNSITASSFYLDYTTPENATPQLVTGTITVKSEKLFFTAEPSFPDGASVTIHLTSGITDAAGNPISNPGTYTFYTRDKSAPEAPQIEPLPERTSVKKVVVHGTGEKDSTIYISGGASLAQGSCDEQGNFSVEVLLKENQLNQLCVTLTDISGNESFPACVSIYQETTEFTVTDAVFENNEVKITFSKPIDNSTFNSTTFKVSSANGVETGTISMTNGDTKGMFIPDNDLSAMALIVEVTTGVKDVEGISLSYPFTKILNSQGGEVIIQGEVYDDATGLPLTGALVKLISVDGSTPPEPAPSVLTTNEGKYVMVIPPGQSIIRVSKQEYSYSHRVVLASSGFSLSVFDSRITPLNEEEKVMLPEGGSLIFKDGFLVYPDGTVDADKILTITGVGPQSIQGRLPYGWSPLKTLDLRIKNDTYGVETFQQSCFLRTKNQWGDIPPASLVLALWDENLYKWVAVSGVSVSPEDITGTINKTGHYAFLIKDISPVSPLPYVIGEPLPSAAQASIPVDVNANLTFDPGVIYPGQYSSGLLVMTANHVISSGIPVQGKVSENYELLTGSTAAFVPYTADLTSYNYGTNTSRVEFNVSPNRRITLSQLKIGKIKTDMVRYAAGTMGVVVGPDGGTVTGDGGAEITIIAGSVNNPVAVTIKKIDEIDIQLEIPSGFEMLGAIDFSLGGAALLKSAVLSLALTREQIDNMPADAQFIMVRLTKLDYEMAWILKSQAIIENNKISSNTGTLPFPGIKEGGSFLFLRPLSPVGFVTGQVKEDNLPLTGALVSLDNHDIKSISSNNYVQPGFLGSNLLTAKNTATSDKGTGEAAINSMGQTFTLDIDIIKKGLEILSISPANNSVDVPLNSTISLLFSKPVDAASFNDSNIFIYQKGTEKVEGIFKLSTDGKQGEFIPHQEFESDTTVNITVNAGLKDVFKNGLEYPPYTSSFQTKDIIPPATDLSKITIQMPDDAGNCVITGEPGAVEPGALVYAYNERTQVTSSVNASTDGSFTTTVTDVLPTDKITITVRDSKENEVVLENKPFISADGKTTILEGTKAAEFITPVEKLGIKLDEGTFPGPVQVTLAEVNDPNQLAVPPEGLNRLKSLYVDFGGQKPLKPFKLSIPAPAGISADDRMFIAREVTVLGEKMLNVVDTVSLKEGRLESNSPPWPGPTRADIYSFIRNSGPRMAVMTTEATSFTQFGIVGRLVDMPDFSTRRLTIPFWPQTYPTLVIKDIDTGEVLCKRTLPQDVPADQTYDFGRISIDADKEPPMLIQTTGVNSVYFDVTSNKITSKGITIDPSDNDGDGLIDKVTISGGKDTTVNVSEEPAGEQIPGKVRIYQLKKDGVITGKKDANIDGSFSIEVPGVTIGDKLLVCIEKGNILTGHCFKFTFSEPVEDLANTGKDKIKLIEVDNNNTDKEVDIDKLRLPSRTEIYITPKTQLKKGSLYRLEIKNLSDTNGNTWNFQGEDEAFVLDFRTEKPEYLGSEEMTEVMDTLLHGGYLYAATRYSVKVFDVSKPGKMIQVGNCYVGGAVRGLALYHYKNDQGIDKTDLMVAGGGGRCMGYVKRFALKLLDNGEVNLVQTHTQLVSDNNAETLRIGLPIGRPTNVKVIGDYAFAAIMGSGFMVIDIKKMPTHGGSNKLAILGHYKDSGVTDAAVYKRKNPNPDPLLRPYEEQIAAVLLVNYFGIKVLDVTLPGKLNFVKDNEDYKQVVEMGFYQNVSSNIFSGLELATEYWVDIDKDDRKDAAEDNDQEDDREFLKNNKLFEEDEENETKCENITSKMEKKDLVFFNDKWSGSVIILDISRPYPKCNGQLSEDYADRDLLKEYGKIPISYDFNIESGPELLAKNYGDMKLDKERRILYLNQGSEGLMAVDMHLTGIETIKKDGYLVGTDEAEDYIIARIKTSGLSRFGLAIDTNINVAYAGQYETGVDAIKLGNPTIKLVYLNDKNEYIEVNKIAPSGLKNNDAMNYNENLENFPGTIYVMAFLPGGVGPTITKAIDVKSLNFDNQQMIRWDDKVKSYLGGLSLSRQSHDKFERYYNIYLSQPIKVTIKPDENSPDENTKMLLSGDYISANLSKELANIYPGYLSEDDCLSIKDKKSSIRAELIDNMDNLDETKTEKPNSPANNPPLYNGVMLHTGELVTNDVDMYIPGRGFDFVFKRTYRSQAIYSGVLGWGWDFNYNKRLLELYNGDIIYYDGTGRRERYKKNGDGGYTTPPGLFAQLKRLEDGRFRVIYTGIIETFDPTGKLITIQDKNTPKPNKMEFYYNIAGQLATVVDTMGRIIEFEYYDFPVDAQGNQLPSEQDSGRLKQITDFDNRTVTFEYDGNGDLEKVNFEGRVKEYKYNTGDELKFKHDLNLYTDPKGQPIIDITYNGDQIGTINYGSSVTDFTSLLNVKDGRGNVKQFALNADNHIEKITEEGYPTNFSYDGNGLLQSVTYPRQNSVIYGYKGDTSLIKTITETKALVGVFEDPDFPVNENRVTTFGYEGLNNNLTSITYPNGLAQNYKYNPSGQLISEYTTDSTGEETMGMVRDYTYHPESKPGGGSGTPPPSPRDRDTSTGGYLARSIISYRDFTQNINWNNADDSESYFHDNRGNLKELQSNNGINASYSVNDFNEVFQETITSSFAGSTISEFTFNGSYEYDNNGNLTLKQSRYGAADMGVTNISDYGYTSRDMLQTESESVITDDPQNPAAKGYNTTYGYDANDNIQNIHSTYTGDNEQPVTETVSFTYTGRDLIQSVTTGDKTFSFTYDGNRNMKTSTDPYNQVTTYAYDGYDRLSKVTDPLNNETIIGRAEFGNLLNVKQMDAGTLLRESQTINDPLGRMKSYTIKKLPQGEVKYKNEYSTHDQEGGGQQITIIDESLNRTWTVKKNSKGLVIEELDPLGNKVNYIYNDRNNLEYKIETVKRADGEEETHTTHYKYNAFNKIEEIDEEHGRVTTFTYDSRGNLTDTKDAEGSNVHFEYDNFSRKTKMIKDFHGKKITTTFTYYPNDLLKTITDDHNNVTTYEYDSQRRLTKVIYPDTGCVSYAYTTEPIEGTTDKFQKVVTETRRDGTIIRHIYDTLQRLKSREISGSSGTTFENYTYDALSRLKFAENNFTRINRTYDALNRITREDRTDTDDQLEKVLNYSYAHIKAQQSVHQTIQYPNGRSITRQYDPLNRISRIEDVNNLIASFSFHGRGYRLYNKQYGNNDLITYHYDQSRRLTQKITKNKNNDLITDYRFGYNKINMKTYEQRMHQGGKADLFKYDAVQRLTGIKFNVPDSEIENPATDQFERSKEISIDNVDNIRSIDEIINNQTKQITTSFLENDFTDQNLFKLNQYERFDQWGLEYDPKGNTTKKGTQDMDYDYRNLLLSVTNTVTNDQVDYKYDPFGRRISKEVTTTGGSNLTKYFYSGNQLIEERDGSDQVQKQYVYGNWIDEVLRIDRKEGDNMVPYWFHSNGIGSITAITDNDGNVIERYSYDLYGMPTITDASDQVITTSTIDNEYMFQGRKYEKETNLYHFRLRAYDPIMGRFLSVDPMGYYDSMNLYQALNANPINFVDPMGRQSKPSDVLELESALYELENIVYGSSPHVNLNWFRAYGEYIKLNEIYKHKTGKYFIKKKNEIDFDSRARELYALIAGSYPVIGEAEDISVFFLGYSFLEDAQIELTPLGRGLYALAAASPFIGGKHFRKLAKWIGFEKLFVRSSKKVIAKLLRKYVKLTKGKVVLGPKDSIKGWPSYLEKARDLGADALDISQKKWKMLTPDQQWILNKMYLDEVIKQGDKIILSMPAYLAKEGTFFYNEIMYLLKKGYQLGPDWMSMVKK